MAASAHFVDHINYLPSGNCWRKRLLCMLQLSVASWQRRQLAAACGMWHLLLHFWPEGKQNMLEKLALKWRLDSVWVLSPPFRLLSSTICLTFCCRINIYLFVFQFHNAHYSLDSAHTHTHRQWRKYSRRRRRRGLDKAELAICPRIDIKIARLLSLWHSDNFAHLCCLLLCAAYQCLPTVWLPIQVCTLEIASMPSTLPLPTIVNNMLQIFVLFADKQ